MFDGFDHDKRAPYEHKVQRTVNGTLYEIIYYVGKGPAGSKIVTSSMRKIQEEDYKKE